MDIPKKKECTTHTFAPLGFDVVKTEQKTVEAVACIFCERCGMFRTKILTFRREFTNEDNNTRTTSQ